MFWGYVGGIGNIISSFGIFLMMVKTDFDIFFWRMGFGLKQSAFIGEDKLNQCADAIWAGSGSNDIASKKFVETISGNFKNAINKFLSSEKYDLILYATPPVTLGSVVQFCKKKYNAKTFLMLKDIFPQNAVDLEMIRKNGLLYKYFRKQERRYYRYSDFIGCMSEGNQNYIIKHNADVSPDKLCVFPNSITIDEVEGTSFHEEKTVFIFGGNLGKPQNISSLLKIIKALKNYQKAEFIIVGNGVEQSRIIELIKTEGCNNLVYRDMLPQTEYEELLKRADVGLISLDPRFTIPNIPSKFQSYLKLKKPILAITDTNTDLKDLIAEGKCGWWCDALKMENIISTVQTICENKQAQIQKGKNGFKFLKDKYNVEHNVEILENLFIKNRCNDEKEN